MGKIIDEKIRGKKLVIFGEIHGTKEIPEFFCDFFNDLAHNEDFNLCLEIPDEFQNEIDEYIDKGDKNLLKNIKFFSKKYCIDGRNSLEFLNLIEGIYKINKKFKKDVKIYCVAVSKINPSIKDLQNEIDRRIADNIIRTLNKKKTFAILGGIHASKKIIEVFNDKIVPVGYLISQKLGDKMCSINISAKEGEFYNMGLKKIKGDDEGYFDDYYDYVIKLDKISAGSFQKI